MEIEHTYTDDMMLSWGEYQAGEPCQACGRPLRDDEPWELRGTMHFTDAERDRYEAEQTRYRAEHGECRSHRWSVEGSLTLHCGRCCPPPPLSPEQRDRLRVLLNPEPTWPGRPHLPWRTLDPGTD